MSMRLKNRLTSSSVILTSIGELHIKLSLISEFIVDSIKPTFRSILDDSFKIVKKKQKQKKKEK